jgi:hypothetical protein
VNARHDETQAYLEAASIATRRTFACDCAERIAQRYEERFGRPLPERDLLDDVILRVRLGVEGDAPELLEYASRHPPPARDLATTLALALSPSAQAWEIAQLLPELCATADDADDERRWMRQHLHAALSSAQQTVLPPSSSADVTRNLRAIPSDSPRGRSR